MQTVKIKPILRLILSMILVGLLSACTFSFSLGGFQPTREIVQRAIELQLSLTQEQLREHLSQHHVSTREMPPYQINRVIIADEEPLMIQDLLSYHIRGSYNLTLRLPDGQVTDRGNPFDLYLQRQKEGKSWRLARSQSSGKNDQQVWATYLIKPPGYL